MNVQRPPPPHLSRTTNLDFPRRCSRGGKEGGVQKEPKIEYDSDRPTREGRASSADGAVPVAPKFHLVRPRLWLVLLERALRLLGVRELRRRRCPEDDRPVRACPVPTGILRRQGVRYRLHRRPCLFRADAAADAYDNKRELRRGEERKKEKNK